MKVKTITFILGLFFFYNLNAQFGEFPAAQYPETITIDSWSGSAWEEASVVTATFDTDCRVETSTTSFSGFPVSRMLYSYENDQTNEIISQIWTGASWSNSSRTESNFTGDALTEQIQSSWDGSNWVLTTRTAYSYNAPDQISELLFQQRDNGSSTWVNSTRTQYAYNSSDLEEEVLNQIWDMGGVQWVNAARTTSSYDGADRILEEIEQTWDGTGMAWLNTTRSTYNYLNATTTEIVTDDWDGADWMPSEKSVNISNSNDLLEQSEFSEWDGADYVPTDRTMLDYNSDNLLIEVINQEYNAGVWENIARSTITYPSCLNLSIPESDDVSFSFYPNPADSHIIFSDVPDIQLNYAIFDVSGRLVKEGHINENNTIAVKTLTEGLYLLKVDANSVTTTKRLMIKH